MRINGVHGTDFGNSMPSLPNFRAILPGGTYDYVRETPFSSLHSLIPQQKQLNYPLNCNQIENDC